MSSGSRQGGHAPRGRALLPPPARFPFRKRALNSPRALGMEHHPSCPGPAAPSPSPQRQGFSPGARLSFQRQATFTHARQNPCSPKALRLPVPRRARKVPPPRHSTKKSVAPVPESLPLGTPHPARDPRTPESHAERTRRMSRNLFPSLVRVESGLCYSRRLARRRPNLSLGSPSASFSF